MNLLEADKEPDELANQLLKKLISLKLDLAAHVSVLGNSVIGDGADGFLDWKEMKREHRRGLDNSGAETLHPDISERFFSAKPLPAESLQALIDLIDRKTLLE